MKQKLFSLLFAIVASMGIVVASVPKEAPPIPTIPEDMVQALFSSSYQNRTFEFAPLGWGSQWLEYTYENGQKIWYSEDFAWDGFTNWGASSYDLNAYNIMHADIYVAVDSKLKITFEALGVGDGGSGWKNCTIVELKANQWNKVAVDLLNAPFNEYDFKDLRYMILEGFVKTDGESAEGTPLSIANVYFIKKPTINDGSDNSKGHIDGIGSFANLTQQEITAVPNYGYHFTQWSDGVTDNPRTIELTQDTTFIAEFAKNTYTISTESANPEWGTTAGGKSALYQDEVEISAIPNYGYHFLRWNDYNTSNPRTVSVTEDKTFTAAFAKNVYSITKNAEHGSISGNNSAEYLDFVTLTVTPDYGYHFVQWSDGLKDNPRIFQITSDTTFTAEFAYDRVGTCGKDLALVWSYDPANKVLTIGNAGEFTENMQFGAEAPTEMEELVIGNNVTAIGEYAFAGISTLKKVTIGESVKTIYDRAFYNCVNLETIFNYRPTPTNAYSTSFDGVDKFECILYVLPNSIDMYKNASVWRDFYYTYAIGAEEATVTTNDVKVEPQDNAAMLTWPTSNEAFSYTIEITKDGVVYCRLTFNANGQLTGIAFAPGRDGQSMAPAAVMTANGLQFTVTGLDSNTQYGYSLTAKDANEQPIATYSGSFTTTSEGVPTGIDNTPFLSGEGRGEASKLLRNGEVLILRDGKTYTIQGVEVK